MALNKIELEGKTYILVPEEVYNETPEQPEKARTGYERVCRNTPYYFNTPSSGGGEVGVEMCQYEDKTRYKNGNYYTDKQLAADNARADSILRRMRQWQALHDVAVEYRKSLPKYYIYYNNRCGTLEVDYNDTHISVFTIYFSTCAKAEEALEVFRDDLTWLHTEYRRRLDEVRE